MEILSVCKNKHEKKKWLVKEANKIMRSSYYTKYEWARFLH